MRVSNGAIVSDILVPSVGGRRWSSRGRGMVAHPRADCQPAPFRVFYCVSLSECLTILIIFVSMKAIHLIVLCVPVASCQTSWAFITRCSHIQVGSFNSERLFQAGERLVAT